MPIQTEMLNPCRFLAFLKQFVTTRARNSKKLQTSAKTAPKVPLFLRKRLAKKLPTEHGGNWAKDTRRASLIHARWAI
jgi:hypothetical protein